jgi:hypothetical protein
MDALSCLAKGAPAIERMGSKDFFEMFYDWVDDESPAWPWPKGSPETMTASEVHAVAEVLSVVNIAMADIGQADDDAIIASGWLERISPAAKTALDLMLARGCFAEDFEELAPSNRVLEATLASKLN